MDFDIATHHAPHYTVGMTVEFMCNDTGQLFVGKIVARDTDWMYDFRIDEIIGRPNTTISIGSEQIQDHRRKMAYYVHDMICLL